MTKIMMSFASKYANSSSDSNRSFEVVVNVTAISAGDLSLIPESV